MNTDVVAACIPEGVYIDDAPCSVSQRLIIYN